MTRAERAAREALEIQGTQVIREQSLSDAERMNRNYDAGRDPLDDGPPPPKSAHQLALEARSRAGHAKAEASRKARIQEIGLQAYRREKNQLRRARRAAGLTGGTS